ncbi:hypothetical protein [Streptomyces gibsoniae]|uniref:Uncharacterized protein n=1 Tax=Streptomyces gibsoniae TaxID=3075529 RepID=A0ABU2TQ20_9ACTN|nr:hypothetical protein [Streptomyces sp. DSM 41699]MDT0463042.1 hypothetical protein [Streptomyces sp. DSM 41699]
MNRLELGLALGIAYALGRRSGRSRQLVAARSPATTTDPAVQRLKAEVWAYAVVRARRLFAAVGRRLGGLSLRLQDVADGNSPGFARLALAVGRHVVRSGARAHSVDEYVADVEELEGAEDFEGVEDAEAYLLERPEDVVDAEFTDEDPEDLVNAEFVDEDPVDPVDAEFVDEDPVDAEFVDEGPEDSEDSEELEDPEDPEGPREGGRS